ncbi:DUF4124 domain-containing protein [Thiobacter aerophilum]|uniref:DUF4124 domain-containing protein n=1 Tax=Thiobacter aerophilum TaxID=3121275 RepID=A0ABV0ED46_9BURK
MKSRSVASAPLLFALFLLPHGALAAKQLYRWVDAQGKVHYGDTLPPEYARQGNAELSKSGRVIKETPPAPTTEQLQALKAAQAREREAREKVEAQRRRDKALLASYTTVDELDLAERRNLEAVDVQIKAHELRMKSMQGRLDALKKQAAGFRARQRPVPPDLSADLSQAQEEIDQLRARIAQANQEKDAIRARFAADRKRFLELKGLAPASAGAAAP